MNANFCGGTENVVSIEKELIYTQCFEEGYDIFDAEYVCRLQKHRPEAVPGAYAVVMALLTVTTVRILRLLPPFRVMTVVLERRTFQV